MPRFQVEFSDERQPEIKEIEAGREVMTELCKLYHLKQPLIPPNTKGISAVYPLDKNGKRRRRVWP